MGRWRDQQAALANLFQTGGSLELVVDLSDGSSNESTGQVLPIELRALKTSQYVFEPEGPNAIPSHHPDVDEGIDNAPAGAGSYIYTLPDLLGGATVVPAPGTGVLDFSSTPLDDQNELSGPVMEFVLSIDTTVDSSLTGGTVSRESLLLVTLLLPAPPDNMGGAPNDDPDPLGGQGGQTDPGTGGDPMTGDGDTAGDGDGDSSGDGDGDASGDGDGDMMSGATGGTGSTMDPDDVPAGDGKPPTDDSGCGCHMERRAPTNFLWVTPAVLLWLRTRRPIPRRLAWWRKL